MTYPGVFIDRGGALVRADDAARDLLKAGAGTYRLHQASGVILFILDEGGGLGPRPGERVAFAGDIKTMPLIGLANLLGQNRETGRLAVKRGDTERVVLLKHGDVASVTSNLPRDRLGAFLIRLGRVTEADLERAHQIAQKTGARIGQVLVQQKLLEPHELWNCIQEQIAELFSEVVQWTEGSFVFYRVPDDHPFPTTPALTMQGLLLESVRRADEMSVFRERIPNVSAQLRRTGKPQSPDAPADEQDALRAVGGNVGSEASVADVAKALMVNEFEATRLCYQLLKAGLIEIPKVATQPPSRAFVLSEEDQQRIYLYNLAFREITDEVKRHSALAPFIDGMRKFTADKAGVHHALFRGVPVDDHGALHEPTLALNLAALHGMGADTNALITEALNELTFFMLFQTGELLDPKSDENLGRRVRLIHASLPQAAR